MRLTERKKWLQDYLHLDIWIAQDGLRVFKPFFRGMLKCQKFAAAAIKEGKGLRSYLD